MKAYKNTLIITFILILLPGIIGLLLWNRLPDQVPTHFSFEGEIDGYSSKLFIVLCFPLIMAGLQLITFVAVLNDPKRRQISSKMIKLILFIVPACSVFAGVLSYGSGLGYSVNVEMITNLMLGLLFIVIGNYLPKVKQNYTMGIKLPWTLDSEMNWNKTHRLSGWIWSGGGIILLGNIFLRNRLLPVVVIAILIIIPVVYSFVLYKKHES